MTIEKKLGLVLAITLTGPWHAAFGQEWIDESNRHAETVIAFLAAFEPEQAAELGAKGYDEAVIDLAPDLYNRYRVAAQTLIDDFEAKKSRVRNTRVAEDLQILLDYLDGELQKATLEHELLLPYYNVAEIVFDGLSGLLSDKSTSAQQAAALQRMRKYAGLVAGTTPLTELAMEHSTRGFDKNLLGPYRDEVMKDLENSQTYLEGVEKLFAAKGQAGWREPYQVLVSQIGEYDAWVRGEILPRARDDHRLPQSLYSAALRDRGVSLKPEELIEEGLRAFVETRNEMTTLARHLAQANGYESEEYLDVIRKLKTKQLGGDSLLEFYRETLAGLEEIIRREELVSLPARPAGIRLASAAETAREPAPHVTHPRLLGDSREYPLFVLPYFAPLPDGSWPATDDTFEANAWTLTAHELRPGHELQFSAMIDGRTSIPRAVFAWNSANIEGWGLYAEAIARPYMPLEGQLISLQWKLLRAARMFLDPMLNLGLMQPSQAKALLIEQVGVQEKRAQSEVERYTYRMPGQATAYYYGYLRLLEIRARAELAMGSRFRQKQFHDIVLAQGLLPPELLESAVMRELAALTSTDLDTDSSRSAGR